MTLDPFLGFLCYVLGTKLGGVLLFRMCFGKGVWLFVSCSGGCLIAAAPQQHHSSSSSSHQQQHQQQAAAGSSRQAAAGSRRQLQAAAGSSRQQQTPAEAAAGSGTADTSRHQQRQQQAAASSSRQRQAAAKLQFYSRVSEVTLGPFLGFLCYVLGTKLGGVLLFRMCFEKGVWLFVSCFGGCLIAAAAPQQQQQPPAAAPAAGSSRQAAAGSRVAEVTLGLFLGFLCYVLGTKLGGVLLFRMCFEKGVWLFVAAASSSRQRQAAAKLQFYSRGFRSDVRPFFGVPLLRFGYEIRWCFAVSDVFRKGCLAVCFLLWRLFDCSSTTAAPAAAAAPAAGSSREQQAGSRRQPQAAAGSSRQQQAAADTSRGSSRQRHSRHQQRQQQAAASSSRQRQAAAKLQFYSRVSEVTLGPFLGFLCYVLGTKLGGVLLFRMCFEKGVWLFVSCFGGCLIASADPGRRKGERARE